MSTRMNLLPGSDVLICEATWTGCLLAWRLREHGVSVTLATSGTSPLHELCHCSRPWTDSAQLDLPPPPFKGLFEASARNRVGGKVFFEAMKVITGVEDILMDAGVKILYAARPVAAMTDGGSLAGIAFGGKFGVAGINSAHIVDCSPFATAARVAGTKFANFATGSRVKVSYAVHLRGEKRERQWRVEGIESVTGEVTVRDHFAEFYLEIPGSLGGHTGYGETFATLHGAVNAIRLASKGTDREFHVFRAADAYMFEPQESPDTGQAPAEMTLLASWRGGGDSVLDRRRDWLRCDEADAEIAQAIAGKAVGKRRKKQTAPGQRIRLSFSPAEITKESSKNISYRLTDSAFDEPEIEQLEVSMPPPPLAASARLVVAGGGTSGAPAAIKAAEMGLDTICVETHGVLGGANTIGGVSKLWYGRWTPGLNRFFRRLREVDRRAENTYSGMHELARRAGTRLLLSCPVCGVSASGGRIRQVLVATPKGLAAVSADLFIDATGDGDLAAWAGCEYSYGSERDDSTLWCSFGTFKHDKDECSRHFASIVDTRSARDYSRALTVARRIPGVFGFQEHPQFYLTPRESRHIRGGARISYRDMLMNRPQKDVVMVFRSNIDIKGIPSSDEAMCGFIERDRSLESYLCSVPLAALMPPSLVNLMVVGKAYSISHDALAMARMQPDLVSLGLVAAVAAAKADKKRKFSSIGIRGLQASLVKEGLLLPGDLVPCENFRPTPEDDALFMLAHRIATGPVLTSEQVTLLDRGQEAAKLLEEEIAAFTPYYSEEAIGRLLCILGSKVGGDILANRLNDFLQRPGFEEEPNWKVVCQNIPDHAWAPQPTFWINAMSHLRDPRLPEILIRLADRIQLNPEKCDCRYLYALSIAYAAERMGNKALAAPVRKLLDQEAIAKSYLPRSGGDTRAANNVTAERHAYLGFRLAAALARCGDQHGYRFLAKITGDIRIFLARSASCELRRLSKQNLGYNTQHWVDWINSRSEYFHPQPWTEKIP